MAYMKSVENTNYIVKDSSHKAYNPEKYPILLAEDNLDDVLITKRAWQKGQIKNKLYVVNDGEEALEFLFRKGRYVDAPSPSLILLDLKMPRVDGFEVLEKIKTNHELKKIPIIVLTSSRRDLDIDRAYELGCNSYIVKPVDFHKFAESVKDIGLYWLVLNQPPA